MQKDYSVDMAYLTWEYVDRIGLTLWCLATFYLQHILCEIDWMVYLASALALKVKVNEWLKED